MGTVGLVMTEMRTAGQDPGLRAAQVGRPDRARAGGAAPAVALVRRHARPVPGTPRWQERIATLTHWAVRAAVRDPAVGLAAQFGRGLPAALVRPVQGPRARRPGPRLHELVSETARTGCSGRWSRWRGARGRGALSPSVPARRHAGADAAARLARAAHCPRLRGSAMPFNQTRLVRGPLARSLAARRRRRRLRAGAGFEPDFASTYEGEGFDGRFCGSRRRSASIRQLATQARREHRWPAPAPTTSERDEATRQRVLQHGRRTHRRATSPPGSVRWAATSTPPTAP